MEDRSAIRVVSGFSVGFLVVWVVLWIAVVAVAVVIVFVVAVLRDRRAVVV